WKLGTAFALVTLGRVAVVVIVINIRALQKGSGVEATTSVALFLITVVAMLIAEGYTLTPVAVVVLMLALLSWKDEMLLFTHPLKQHELHAAITLGILSFVILPLLPEGALDPWGLFAPRRI